MTFYLVITLSKTCFHQENCLRLRLSQTRALMSKCAIISYLQNAIFWNWPSRKKIGEIWLRSSNRKKRTVVLTYVLLFHLNPLIMRCKCIIYTAWNSFWVKLSDWERSEADILHDKGVSLNAEIAVCKKKPYVPWNHIHEKCLFEIYHDPSVTWREIFIRFLLCI